MPGTSPGYRVLRTLNEFFSSAPYEGEVIFILLLPTIIIAILLIFFREKSQPQSFEELRAIDKNIETFEVIRLQRGLEEFDRDFLLEIALDHHCAPAYKMLMNKEIFERVEKELIFDLKQKGESINDNKRLQYLLKLKKRIF
jgi:hypothetical protein